MKKFIYIFIFFLLYSCKDSIITSEKILDNETISGTLIFEDSTYCCFSKPLAIMKIDTIAGISDTLALAFSDADQYYEFDNIIPEQLDLYIVMLTDDGLVDGQDNTPDGDIGETELSFGNSIPVYLEPNEDDTGNDFYFGTNSSSEAKDISGYAKIDTDGDGFGDIPAVGQRIELYHRSPDNVPQTPLVAWDNTDSNGLFSIDNIEAGEYILYFIGDGILQATLISGYDVDQETGEPASDNPLFIPVDLPTELSKDSLNYYLLESNGDCQSNPVIDEYWAFCDTNLICELNEIPLITRNQNWEPLLLLDGYTFQWNNLTTGESSTSDVFYVKQFEEIEVSITYPDGCVYNDSYYANCEPNLEGDIHLTEMMIGWDPNLYEYELGEIVWNFNPSLSELTISHNITSPTNNSLIEEGVYNYFYEYNGTYYELIIDYIGLEFSLGDVVIDGDTIKINNDIEADGELRIFTKI